MPDCRNFFYIIDEGKPLRDRGGTACHLLLAVSLSSGFPIFCLHSSSSQSCFALQAYALCYDRWSSGVKLFNNNAPLFACNLSFSFVTPTLSIRRVFDFPSELDSVNLLD
jgi:hypothetical protein